MRTTFIRIPLLGIVASAGLFLFTVMCQRKRIERRFLDSLAEKEVLLKELAHRTKNNLQVIENLLSLQAAGSEDEGFTSALSEAQDRIRAMALVHEKLCRSGNFGSVSLKEYLKDLMDALLRIHQGSGGAVATNLDLEDVRVPVNEALSFGIIINELVSNSLKHAFPGGKEGTISLSLRNAGQNMEIRYRDDGPGLPEDLDLSKTKTLGLKLIYNIAVKQLHGDIAIRREPEPGIVLTFGGSNPILQ